MAFPQPAGPMPFILYIFLSFIFADSHVPSVFCTRHGISTAFSIGRSFRLSPIPIVLILPNFSRKKLLNIVIAFPYPSDKSSPVNHAALTPHIEK